MQFPHPLTASCLPVALVLLLVPFSGCGGKPAQVSGTVSVDGVPLDTGTIAFVPSGQGMRATALIESDGSYEVRTNRETGLDTGHYKVAISAREVVKPEGGGLPMPGEYLVPRQYGNTETSGLEYTIEEGSNVIDINLQSDAK